MASDANFKGAIHCLALFDETQQAAIIHYIKSNQLGAIRNDLDRGADAQLPPPIFSLASPRALGTDDPNDIPDMARGLAYVIAWLFRTTNFDKDLYKSIFEDVFHNDETEAEKLASNVSTVDDASGFSGNAKAVWSAIVNKVTLGTVTPEVNTATDDIDAPYEILRLGEAIRGQIKRNMLMTRQALSSLRPNLPEYMNDLITTLREARNETGDLVSPASFLRSMAPYHQPLILRDETGGFFQNLVDWGQNAIESVGQALQSPAVASIVGTAANILAPGTGSLAYNAITGLQGGGGQGQAAGQPAPPSAPQAPANAGPPISVTLPNARRALQSHIADATGASVEVRPLGT